MKSLTTNRGLVEEMIFEAYKNKVTKSANIFKKQIKAAYGFEPSSDLYTAIINYQIKKYGRNLSLNAVGRRDYTQRFDSVSAKRKKRDIHRRIESTNALLKRAEEQLKYDGYKIEKEKLLNCWIVWEIHSNYLVDIYHGKTKRDCKKFILEVKHK